MNWIVWVAVGGGILTLVAVILNQIVIDLMERRLREALEKADAAEESAERTQEQLRALATLVSGTPVDGGRA